MSNIQAFELDGTYAPVCPFCGVINREDADLQQNGSVQNLTCIQCDEVYTSIRNLDRTFSTYEQLK